MEVLNLLSDDVETDDAGPGENLKLRLKGIEEEEILPGFILCSPDNICHSGRTFDAQVKTSATVTQLLRVGLHTYKESGQNNRIGRIMLFKLVSRWSISDRHH